MIELKNVSKFYYSKGIIASGFTKINLKFNIGEFVAITGESGSGKSTLLNVISGLDSYEEGEMYVNGKETSHYIEKDWENYRRKYIGNIYQNFNLINSYTVYQNIDLILSLNGIPKKERKEKILSLLSRVKMTKYKNTKVSKLSGGQKQRIAIARALAKDVPVIIADEPTGSLDKESAKNIIKLLSEIAKDKLVIIVTHNYEQVADYVTRKITMHDGRVIEDSKLKKVEEVNDIDIKSYKNIKVFDKLKLGFRNTFNVIPKFILLFLVYSFIVAALMGEYSFFKKGEYENKKNGFSYVFQDTNDHRIVLNKKDKSSFTIDELNTLKNLDNVDYIMENDPLIDKEIDMTDESEELWFSMTADNISNFKGKVNIGRLPENDNEIVILGDKDDYYISTAKDELLEKNMYFINEQGLLDKSNSYKIVGIKYTKKYEKLPQEYKIYVRDPLFNKLLFKQHQENSTITVNFMGKNHQSSNNSTEFKIETNNWIAPGEAAVSEDFNTYCDKYNCKNKQFSINIKNMYFEDNKTLTVTKLYNSKNITSMVELQNYDKNLFDYDYNGIIYINQNDYDSMFNKGTYQISIYVKDIEKIDETNKYLQDNNYNTLMVKDTLIDLGFSELIRILKLIVTIILVVTLFFISYFIIKIILKSRNIYFSIIRMLGASKNICRQLLIIELLIITNLSYFIFIALAEINKTKYLNIKFINTVNTYFKFNDYVILYLILIIMSILISYRYSRKLFKTSVMNAYREEV